MTDLDKIPTWVGYVVYLILLIAGVLGFVQFSVSGWRLVLAILILLVLAVGVAYGLFDLGARARRLWTLWSRADALAAIVVLGLLIAAWVSANSLLFLVAGLLLATYCALAIPANPPRWVGWVRAGVVIAAATATLATMVDRGVARHSSRPRWALQIAVSEHEPPAKITSTFFKPHRVQLYPGQRMYVVVGLRNLSGDSIEDVRARVPNPDHPVVAIQSTNGDPGTVVLTPKYEQDVTFGLEVPARAAYVVNGRTNPTSPSGSLTSGLRLGRLAPHSLEYLVFYVNASAPPVRAQGQFECCGMMKAADVSIPGSTQQLEQRLSAGLGDEVFVSLVVDDPGPSYLQDARVHFSIVSSGRYSERIVARLLASNADPPESASRENWVSVTLLQPCRCRLMFISDSGSLRTASSTQLRPLSDALFVRGVWLGTVTPDYTNDYVVGARLRVVKR